MTSHPFDPRAPLRRLRSLPDRMLHPPRRRAARRKLERTGWPESVLFVCHGNICRSPYAAEVFRHRAGEAHRPPVEISSAGFIGPDRRSPPVARRVASERGVDLEEHRSSLVSHRRVVAAALVLVMDAGQRRRLLRSYGGRRDRTVVLGDLDPEPWRRREISDPVGGGPDVFARVYDRVDRCVEALVRTLAP